VLHKLQTKQYVIIDTKKVNKNKNTASKDIYSNVIGCQQSKIFNITAEETNFKGKNINLELFFCKIYETLLFALAQDF
jgi:hypothetical protein